jgi:kynurenine formamidase
MVWCSTSPIKKGELITPEELIQALKKISYILKPGDIVLIRTDCCKQYEKLEYQYLHPGMSREGTLWLIDQGIKVMGTDAWGWDASMDVLAEAYKKGEKEKFWASHFAGREKEYCQIEKMCNLDKLPPHGFMVFVFPLKIEGGSGSPVRAVAMVK